MRVSDFHYDLPAELIAQYPLAERGASRMLVVDGTTDRLADASFADLPTRLRAGDLLVFNDTRVMPARLRGHKAESGGQVELLVERITGAGHTALCHLRSSKPPRAGTRLLLADGAVAATVSGREDDLFVVEFAQEEPLPAILEAHGEIPLPPYIERTPEAADRERYQTVYARHAGAVAAPTAGLHFDEAMLAQLAGQGVETAQVTLHVGAGTFRPVRAENVAEHTMHREWMQIPQATVSAVQAARARGGRVIAVGTTVVRTLESAAGAGGQVRAGTGETDLFLTPGARFRVVDGLLTNFHLPGSTLLMLVCAFAGHERVLRAYRHAVAERYRFFSYGDAMLLWPEPGARASGTHAGGSHHQEEED